ncbi:MAG: bifunctional methylenetetrahydrofolate dehydrogenase/methenyltetrahydrofolate cyclohydrolase [Candidatus Pelagibacter sp.]|nr:bifunctional methylenetetrahydrofolate dehydrogenase/methenyltetrahydrofolate cyclohydrolase [Candidatus Pelagibacter sp.]OUV87178.1 MAG: bifunctional methylenetetrahydrofolate dehydrogenase/methenyltetrahydrofolate cyclohydrolase [Pelagibacteraceae bacterium TMED136]|tara:strand:+ start:3023 stop:3880 length:858 start_codon:yes stop_codon:yes gene_type:complete
MIIDGKKIAEELRDKIKKDIKELAIDKRPGLTVILIGEHPASQIYVKNKEKFAKEVGINSNVLKFNESISESELKKEINKLNNNSAVHGILVQLPLPEHINQKDIIETINPDKDVDGFHPINVGNLSSGNDAMVPCTPLGCYYMIKKVIKDLSGLNAVVVGRSNINGKPMTQLLLRENCTVTIVHSKTKNIEKICKNADLIIAAVGKAHMIQNDWVKDTAVIIDVGINRVKIDGKNKIVGDVDFQNIKDRVKGVSPVPGGVGPMTIACLLENTMKAFKKISVKNN